MVAEGGQPGKDPRHPVLADAADGQDPRPGIGPGIPVALREARSHGAHARGAEEIGGGGEDRSPGGAVVVPQRASKLATEGRDRAGGERELGGRGRPLRRQLVDAFHPGRAGPGAAAARVESVARGGEPGRKRLHHGAALLEDLAHDRERLPEALLDDGRSVGGRQAAPRAGLATRHHQIRSPRQLCHRLAETVGAHLVAGAMRGLALDPVLPALHRAVDDGRRLAVVQRQRGLLGGGDLADVLPVGHDDHVPVVEVEQLRRAPLHVVAWLAVLAAHAVGVDGGLVPVEVDDRVAERGGAGRSQGLGHAPGREPALALDDVDARGIGAEVVPRAQGEPQRGGDAHPGGPGGEADEGGGRGRVAVEGLGPERLHERRPDDGVAAETQEILEAEPLLHVLRQQVGSGEPGDLVAERPHRVEPHGLVPGRIGDDVGVLPVGLRQVVVERVEEERGHDASGGDRAARVARGGHVVVEEGAE